MPLPRVFVHLALSPVGLIASFVLTLAFALPIIGFDILDRPHAVVQFGAILWIILLVSAATFTASYWKHTGLAIGILFPIIHEALFARFNLAFLPGLRSTGSIGFYIVEFPTALVMSSVLAGATWGWILVKLRKRIDRMAARRIQRMLANAGAILFLVFFVLTALAPSVTFLVVGTLSMFVGVTLAIVFS